MSENSEEKQVEIEDLSERIIREVFKCEQCSYCSVRKWYLKQHIKSVHETIEVFKCELCHYTSALKGLLKQHIGIAHLVGAKRFEYPNCRFVATKKVVLKRHLSSVHNMGLKLKCEKSPYYDFKRNLKHHLASVHHVGFNCKKCPFTAALKERLMRHELTVHNIGDTRYTCEQCPYKSPDRWKFKKHVDVVHSHCTDTDTPTLTVCWPTVPTVCWRRYRQSAGRQ